MHQKVKGSTGKSIFQNLTNRGDKYKFTLVGIRKWRGLGRRRLTHTSEVTLDGKGSLRKHSNWRLRKMLRSGRKETIRLQRE